jgi:hypothetical protein
MGVLGFLECVDYRIDMTLFTLLLSVWSYYGECLLTVQRNQAAGRLTSTLHRTQ